ncbi:MAG: hypothetical protein ABIP03_05020 [Aquihabitans sp.]
MRLEQLVLYGPSDDDRVRFGPQFTVFGGLAAADRLELIETIVDALTGRLSNASVVYSDRLGRRVFADRTGATFAEDGVIAPGPSELLGKDPSAVAGLLTLTADDLGLGPRIPAAELQSQLVAARHAIAQLQSDHVRVVERSAQVQQWRAELARVDRRIASSGDDLARWSWFEQRRQLDELRTELAMFDAGRNGETDEAILASVDALRTAGATWADLAAAASELSEELGPLPPVSAADLARVAATPDALPATFNARVEAWRAARDAMRTADAEVTEASRASEPAADPLVEAFARLDQDRLWAAHRTVCRSAEAYNSVSSVESPHDEADEATIHAVEQAHLEVVRAQRHVDGRVRPGIIGAAALIAGGLLALLSLPIPVSIVMFAAAAGLTRWLVLIPRQALAKASDIEAAALSHTDAGSWLGLHLRRLDEVTNSADRKRFESAANHWIVAMVDWEAIAGDLAADDLTARADEVRRHAQFIDPKAAARRKEQARIQRDSTVSAERSARASLAKGLEHFGLASNAGSNLNPEELLAVVNRRIEAGRIARRAAKLATLRGREATASKHLEAILGHLGFVDGSLENRLERAIQAIAVARQYQAVASGTRDRTDIEAEIARLTVIVERTHRPGWSEDGETRSTPADPNVLEARRREISELVSAGGQPDVVGAEHRYRVGLAKVHDLEARLNDLAAGPGTLTQRLAARLGRTTKIGGHDETVPVLIDDAFARLEEAEKGSLLDLLVELSEHTQIILLSDDPVVASWARSRVGQVPVTLFEVEPVSAPASTSHPVSVG